MTAKSHFARARASLAQDQIRANRNRGHFSRFKRNCLAFVFAASMVFGSAHLAQAQWTTTASENKTTTTDKVGIGTTGPIDKLEVVGGIHTTGTAANSKANDFLMDQFSNGGRLISVGPDDGQTRGKISFIVSRSDSSSALTALFIDPAGNVGISNNMPTAALDVIGDIKASGVIHAKYQDVAEWVPASEHLAAGTVVVLDSTKSNHVTSSSVSYDTRVAGVISAQPGIALGEKGEGKVLVATTGRVKVKVDATKSPIRIGDLLVSSDVLGVAMKSEPIEMAGRKMHMPGTLIGKALEPLAKGKGEILVLLSLQ